MSLAKKELDFLSMENLKDILLNKEELEEHAKEIAKQHRTWDEPKSIRKLIEKLDENFQSIAKVYQKLISDAQQKRPLSPASEWLLDNFYKVEEQVKDVRLNLLKDRFMKLYTIKSGLFKNYPRVYALVLDYISHTDGRLEEDSLVNFIKSYQTQRVLSIAEVWSISLMVRIALIKNIRIISERIYENQIQWQQAEELAKKEPNEIIKYLKEKMDYADSFSPSFIEHLLRQLRKMESETGDVVTYLEKKLSDLNNSVKNILDQEHREQAARKLSIGNSITSLNTVATLDWNDIFESINIVEKTLGKDPLNSYKTMDFESRDYYRIQVEKISVRTKRSEISIAKTALELAQKNFNNGIRDKRSHVGYFLLDKGIEELLEALQIANKKEFNDKSLGYYLFPIFLISVIVPLMVGFFFTDNLALSILLTVVLVIPMSDIAVHLVNYIMLKTHPPKHLARYQLKNGIPNDSRTFVVVPTLLPNVDRVKELIGQLEIHYLSNKGDNIYFGIVGDFKDAKNSSDKDDSKIIDAALDGIRELNSKYNGNDEDIFYFFIRDRKHIKAENKWMGWERKRGALVEFNRLLLGSKDTSYKTISARPPSKIQYVITLDADTQLPIGTAKTLVGIMSHPLYKPVLAEKGTKISEGYGLIQPRIGVELESANKSFFTKVFAGQGGIDPYTTASSDIYQDLFSEGIFTGKGIYHLESFAKVLHEAIPENSILSHDLLEGSYLRTGLATDVELIDGYPAKYSSFIMRLHRWTRGDWQLLPWVLSKVSDANNKKVINPLSSLSKWKIVDNLRRSLVPIFTFTFFAISLIFVNTNVWLLVGIALLVVVFPAILNTFEYFKVGQSEKGYGKNNVRKFYGVSALWYQVLLNLVFLPYQSYILSDAIIRSLYRVYVSKVNMLEWVTAADAEKGLKKDVVSYIKRMLPGIILALLVGFAAYLFNPRNFILAIFLVVIWISAPYFAFNIGKEVKENQVKLNEYDIEVLRRIARKTWGYYDDFADGFNNFLPPDNYQLYPPKGIAPRTSPTNIGCMLMGVLVANDFGYLTLDSTLSRVENTLTTVERMETWKGHLYNWYDTRTLEVLRPTYVSTVDSGNFISNLITLKEGLKDLKNKNLFDYNKLLGLRDTALLAEASFDAKKLFQASKIQDISSYHKTLQSLEGVDEEGIWKQKYNDMLKDFREEVEFFVPRELENLEQYNKLKEEFQKLNQGSSLNNFIKVYTNMSLQIEKLKKNKDIDNDLLSLKEKIDVVLGGLTALSNKTSQLIRVIDKIIDNTQFKHLYDDKRNLFSIGYNVEEERLTNSYYDLLASEARTTSYIAIARGEVPKKHWFKLGRGLTIVDGFRSLVSWTGTMFEYFMPNLLLKTYGNTLLDETFKSVVLAQKKFGAKRNVPWGVSESGYYTFDMMLNYQYRAFGLSDLGLKRGLANDTVISPYSTVLGITYDPKGVIDNIERLISEGLEGTYGFFEAVDFTPARALVHGQDKKIVKSFMAHHQGMILMALDNYLYDNVLQKRFHQNPVIKAGELMLQEKVPVRAVITKEFKEFEDFEPTFTTKIEDVSRTYEGISNNIPRAHILSNGQFSTMITDRGGGFSKVNDIQITRWREDPLLGRYGSYILINQNKGERIWSATSEPLGDEGDSYKVQLYNDKVEFQRYDDNITTKTEVVVSSEDNVELRKVTLSNHGAEETIIDVTSFMEVVVGSHPGDLAHPAFNNLFVRTEIVLDDECIVASRRPREEEKKTIWGFHGVFTQGETIGALQYETMRSSFIGRGNDIKNAVALTNPLTNSSGIVLDPIFSLRKVMRIPAGKSVHVTFVTGVADDKNQCIELNRKYRDVNTIDRTFQLSFTRSQVEMSYLGIKGKDLRLYQEMMSPIIYQSPVKEKYRDILNKNTKSQSGLWSYGISGDIPIVLLIIKSTEDIDMFTRLLKGHEYWTTKGLKVDLVVLNEDESSYHQPLQQMLNDVIATSHGKHILDVPGGVFLRNGKQMPQEDRNLLYTVAKLVILGHGGPLSKQIQVMEEDFAGNKKEFKESKLSYLSVDEPLNLEYYNGFGGFSPDGLEYIIRLKGNKQTPAPWINVISNRNFGFQISENGAGFTWAENSRENKLTPWSNDPVSDPPEEIIYIRDNETGRAFTPTPLPIREKESYTIRHGMGYSTFHHDSNGIAQDLTVYVPKDDSVKINLLKLKNNSKETRKITLFYYLRPVMGVNEQMTKNYLISSFDEGIDGLLVKNPYSNDFPNRKLFVVSSERVISYTGNRREFVGNKDMSNPKALELEGFSNIVGAGFDPCVAIQTNIELKPMAEKEITFVMGHTLEDDDYKQMAGKYKSLANCKTELQHVKRFWKELLCKIQVQTPDKSMDYMLNSWLLYQTISCRVWARSAFYQSGGAYGYRDQLQDTMNVVYNLPEATREQILLHCAHQFLEGDVQHWWHPGAGDKGIRTRFSDDLLWLPLVTADYVKNTGDFSILTEEVHFLEDDPLGKEDERYGIPRISMEKATVYEHCVRAIERGIKLGANGIPLMGSGDWNDGMSTVGNKGKGESVWLGWFLYKILNDFSPLTEHMEDGPRGERYKEVAEEIASNIEKNAWDGQWYLRAFYDDGSPLGSSKNTECIIDSLGQTWSIISKGGKNKDRIDKAMDAVERYLIKREESLIQLFTPPFDESDQKPGYIKGYVPGVRENGGQYTHAAIWVINAFAMYGDGDKAWELFNMVNPINHARTPIESCTYKVEPYVIAADVYAVHPHVGRGGWTWYTGAAGWMYRVGLEHILGLKKQGDSIVIDPCIPKDWNQYHITYTHGTTLYQITVKNPHGVNRGVIEVYLDGNKVANKIQLLDDKVEHIIDVIMG